MPHSPNPERIPDGGPRGDRHDPQARGQLRRSPRERRHGYSNRAGRPEVSTDLPAELIAPPTPPRAAPRVLRAHARVARVGGLHLCRESRARLHDGRGLGELVVLVLGDAGVRGKDDVRLAVVHSLEIDAVGVVKEDGQVGAELLVGIRDPEAQAGLPSMENPVSRDWATDRRERPLPIAGTPP